MRPPTERNSPCVPLRARARTRRCRLPSRPLARCRRARSCSDGDGGGAAAGSGAAAPGRELGCGIGWRRRAPARVGGAGSGSGATSAGGASLARRRRLHRRLVLHRLGFDLLRRRGPRRAPVVGELVDRRSAACERRGGGSHRGDLLARGELRGGVEALAGPGQRLDQVAQRPAAVRCHERGRRHERRHPLRRGAKLAQASAAAQAGAHVRAQERQLIGARLSVRERRQERLVASALDAALDPGHAAQECLPTLGEQAVHLRVGPTRHRADLAVREPLRLQPQRAHLVRLQLAERLGAQPQPLEPLRLLVCGRRGRRPVAQLAVVGHGGVAVALSPQRPGLVLDHRLQPRDQLVLARARRLREQDFDAALVRVLRVLGRHGVATRRRQDLPAVPRQQPESSLVDLAPRGPGAAFRHQHDIQERSCNDSPPGGRCHNCAKCVLFLSGRCSSTCAPLHSRVATVSLRADWNNQCPTDWSKSCRRWSRSRCRRAT